MNNSYIHITSKFWFAFIGLYLLAMTINAQSIRKAQSIPEEGIRPDIPIVKNKLPGKHTKPINPKKKGGVSVPDTVYCIQTKKQHGWFAPVGIITKENASHRSLTYRFTNRNAQGNWCKLELIDGYGNHATGGMSPYILKVSSADTDSLANSDWVEKIKTECIYEFIPDPTGKNVIQERAYDKDMNIVYTYSRTPIGTDSLGHKKFVGSYRDYYGLPAEMRKDITNTYTYGTLVMLTEDCWGNDSVIEYMDAKGLKKLNSDGVAMEVYICDKEGHLLKQQSRDTNGNLVIDNWGNCGVEYVWNANHTIASATYMDDRWQPMRMPSLRSTGDKDDVIRTIYKYDKYGREIEQAFFTLDGKPDKNGSGIHRMTCAYDERGNMLEVQILDQTDSLVVAKNGYAIYKAQYNEQGKPIKRQWFDNNKNLINKEEYKYDEKGTQVLLEGYSIKDGTEILVYKNEVSESFEHNLYTDGTSRIDSIDSKGRQTKSSCYDSNGKLYVPQLWAEQITTYQDSQGKTIMSETTYDSHRKPLEVDGIYKTINVIDSINHKLFKYRYDKNNILKETFGHLYDNDFKWVLAEYDMNRFGNTCRAGGTAGVRHYVANVVYNQKHQFATLVGRDEFDEPDYITADGGNTYYYQKLPAKGKTIFYDEDNNPIDDFDKLRDALPKAMSVEIVDSIAYELGLKDNDVILRYGTYINDMDSCDLEDFRNNWILHNVIGANKPTSMLVFRVYPETKQYGIIRIDSLRGTLSELGFMAHCRYLTHKQKNRIKTCFDAYKENHDNINNEDLESLAESLDHLTGDARIMVAYTELYRKNREKPYPDYVSDPGFLLAAYVPSQDLKWLSDGKTYEMNKIINNRRGSNSYAPLVQFFFTTNLSDIKLLNSMENYLSVNWSTIRVKDDTYKQIQTIVKEADRQIDNYRKQMGNKKKETFESIAKELYTNFYNYIEETENEYKGIDELVVYDFARNRQVRDNAFNIINTLQPDSKNGYIFSSGEEYGSIVCMDVNNNLRISSALLFNSQKLIYATGSFSRVQLNKISNILK